MKPEAYTELKGMLLEAPVEQIDPTLLELIAKWDDTPNLSQILEVLDKGAYYSLTSDFAQSLIGMLFKLALSEEEVSDEQANEAAMEIRKTAHWINWDTKQVI